MCLIGGNDLRTVNKLPMLLGPENQQLALGYLHGLRRDQVSIFLLPGVMRNRFSPPTCGGERRAFRSRAASNDGTPW